MFRSMVRYMSELVKCSQYKIVLRLEVWHRYCRISGCLSIVKYFASPSKSCIPIYTFSIVNIRFKKLFMVPFELHYNEIPLCDVQV